MSLLLRMAVALLFAAAQFASAATPANYAGRQVSEVLRSLSRSELQFVFSSQLLPDSLRVQQEPERGDSLATARAILTPHGLTLDKLQTGLYAVVALPVATASPVPTERAVEALREVIVAASRYRIGEVGSSLFALDRADFDSQPGIGSDPVRELGRLPGITNDSISAQSNVRGGETGEVLMLLDGYPLRRAFHLSGYQSLFSVLDAGIVRGADVFTGGYPARYGNRMAGVFDFHTIDGFALPQRSLGIDFFNASGRTAGQWRSLDYVASARVGTLSPLLHAFAPSAGDPRYTDAYLKMSHGSADALRLTGNVLWSRDELRLADRNRGEQAEFEDRLRYLWLRADRNFTPALAGSVWFGQSAIQSFREGTVASASIASGSVQDRRTSTIWDLRAFVQWQWREHHILEAGGEFTQEQARYTYASSARFAPAVQQLFGIAAGFDRAADLTPHRRRSSLFVAHRWQLTPALTSEFGVRGQAIVSTGLEADWVVEPRFGLRWQMTPRTRLNIGWGRFHQADEVHELKIEDGLDNFPEAQRSDHLIAGIEHELGTAFSLRAELFSKRQTDPRARYENLINRRTLLPEIAPDRVQILPNDAALEGIELSGQYRGGGWRSWMSLSFSRAEDATDGVHIPRSWDETWSFNGGARWERGAWVLGGSLAAHRGFPTSVVVNSSGPQLTARNSERLGNFLELNLRAQYTQPVSLGSLHYSFELLNATYQFNQCCIELQFGPQGLYGRRLRGLPLFPSLGVRWEW
ncbi:MAG: TonB-dependent receptor [Steroidobacteraceae bacterium]